MVNKDKTISFEKFFKILFFIAVHNAQASSYNWFILFKERV